MVGLELLPSTLDLCDGHGLKVEESECPISEAIRTRRRTFNEYSIRGRSGREVKIEMNVVPVVSQDVALGAVILMHDSSVQVDLKRRLRDLYTLSVLDPLTHVANRAEFERMLREYSLAHRSADSKCCIIICDIDHFKQVNDTYGHHIGDQALIAFAHLLQNFVRARDIVARYGGEEFVILCANCDLAAALERAEQIRLSLTQTPQQMLNGKAISASFGVAELKPEEDITDFFVRADKALYRAKELGRNRVVKASNHVEVASEPVEESSPEVETSPCTGIKWRHPTSPTLFCEEFVSRTPISMLIEKLRGYVQEKRSTIRQTGENFISMMVRAVDPCQSWKSEIFRVDVELHSSTEKSTGVPISYVRVAVYTPRRRMFKKPQHDLHRFIVDDLKKYLMINDEASSIKLNSLV
jgi:diguanylate cyclase (GGDEF)-like protein